MHAERRSTGTRRCPARYGQPLPAAYVITRAALAWRENCLPNFAWPVANIWALGRVGRGPAPDVGPNAETRSHNTRELSLVEKEVYEFHAYLEVRLRVESRGVIPNMCSIVSAKTSASCIRRAPKRAAMLCFKTLLPPAAFVGQIMPPSGIRFMPAPWPTI